MIKMNILVFAPHADDEILGVGGTMAKHIANGDKVFVCVATRPYEPIFSKSLFNVIRNETIKAHDLLGVKKTFFLEFPAVMMETVSRYEMNKKISDVIDEVKPDEVYIPHSGDMQKDHRILADAVMVAVRPKNEHKVSRIYAYETLSETEWNQPCTANAFIPTVYNDISASLEKKKKAMACYASQLADFPNPRSLKAVDALARFRGSAILSDAAEAFVLVREIK